jgi:hypothetical protein
VDWAIAFLADVFLAVAHRWNPILQLAATAAVHVPTAALVMAAPRAASNLYIRPTFKPIPIPDIRRHK